MECVEAALKTSIRKEMALKSSPQTFPDDLCTVNGQNGVISCDDFFVDGLLDFSNEDGCVEGEPEENNQVCVSVSPKEESQEDDNNSNNIPNFYAKDELASLPASELPADELESLEWLSHFVEDSFSEYSAPFPAGIFPENPKSDSDNPPEPETHVPSQPCFKTPVPAKARSKRTRTGGRVWSLGSPSLTESSSSSTSSSTSSSPSSPWLIYSNSGLNLETVEHVCWEKPPSKKLKKKPALDGANGGCGAQPPRRCSHCGVQKTPQWRTGPLGAKTLCNACGVRYKSGRLLPEYRPACSPTFSSELHSNHHRKVLEMRRKKEMVDDSSSGLAPPVVPSF